MANLYYVDLGKRPLHTIVEAVSAHLEYLGTHKSDLSLNRIRRIYIEGAGQYGMPPELNEELKKLEEVNRATAATFRTKLLQHYVLSAIVTPVYERVKERLYVVEQLDLTKPSDAVILSIAQLVDRMREYESASKSEYGDTYPLEKRIHNVLKKAITSRLDDLSVGQALGFSKAEASFSEAESKRAGMEGRLVQMLTNIDKKIKP